ncbi:hypothetical protein FRC03_009128 [Tulasnella sp. 419]|nr:hypothetical protein FRC03_009128 [Tulasnella sp. 419]
MQDTPMSESHQESPDLWYSTSTKMVKISYSYQFGYPLLVWDVCITDHTVKTKNGLTRFEYTGFNRFAQSKHGIDHFMYGGVFVWTWPLAFAGWKPDVVWKRIRFQAARKGQQQCTSGARLDRNSGSIDLTGEQEAEERRSYWK